MTTWYVVAGCLQTNKRIAMTAKIGFIKTLVYGIADHG